MSLELFTHRFQTRGAVATPPQWNYVRSVLQRSLNKAVNYYQQANLPVMGGHPLLHFLLNINVPVRSDLQRYVASVESYALINAGQLGFCTSWNAGKFHAGKFYGPGCTEIYIATDEYVDPQYVHDNWRDYASVEVLAHPKSDLNVQYCNGQDYSKELGLVILKVNVVALLVQFRAFYLHQMTLDPSLRKSLNRFIGGVVIPNMMRSHLEIALLNRLAHVHFNGGQSPEDLFRKHVFAVTADAAQVDPVLPKILEITQRGVGSFNVLLQQLPAIQSVDMDDVLMLPEVAPTRQINWALLCARLKYIAFLASLAGTDNASVNRMTYNQLRRNLSLYNTYDMMEQRLPTDLFFEMQSYIDIIETFGDHRLFN